VKALSIRQPWAWLLAHGYKDVENRNWKTNVRGRILLHASKRLDYDGLDWVRDTFPHIPLPENFEQGGLVGAANLTDCVSELYRNPWFCGTYGFVMKDAIAFPIIPLIGQLTMFKPLGDYSVRHCRGHWHVTVGEEADDLALDGDPYKSMYEALLAAFKHKREMDQDREDFRRSQKVSARATRTHVAQFRRPELTHEEIQWINSGGECGNRPKGW
jgi:hypothetical protein